VGFATKSMTQTYVNVADSMEGLNSDGNWGVDYEDGRTVFSASPGERYEGNLDEFLQLPRFQMENGSFLEFKTKFDMETDADFGFVEVSSDDGKTWVEVPPRDRWNLYVADRARGTFRKTSRWNI
jgi:hypothetical protein